MEALADLRGHRVRIAFLHSRFAELAEVGVGVEALGDRRVRRQQVLPQRNLDVTAIRDRHRVGDGLRVRSEAIAHLLRARKVVVGSREAESLLLLAARAGLQAEQDVVGLGVLGLDVVRVVGGHERQAGATRDLDQTGAHRVLLGDAVVLELEEVVVRTEDLGMFASHRLGGGHVTAKDRLGQLATEARGQADQALGVLREQLAIDARLVVVALEVRGADQLDEVAIAGVVACEQDQVVGVAIRPSFTIVARARRHVHLAAEDRVDLRRTRAGVEIDSSVEHAVVGDGDGRLPHRLRAVDELLDT